MASPSEPQTPRGTSIVYRRKKQTDRSVLLADSAARVTISVGGLFVIFAVLTIMVFLVYVCLPLLDSGSAKVHARYALANLPAEQAAMQMDELQTLATFVDVGGKIGAFHAPTGLEIEVPDFDFGGIAATTLAHSMRGDDLLFGFADGTVRTGRVNLKAGYQSEEQLPQGLRKLNERDRSDGHTIYSKIPGQFRALSVETSLDAPVQVAETGVAIRFADYRIGGTSERPVKTFVTIDDSGVLRLSRSDSVVNMMTGETTTELSNSTMPLNVPVSDVHSLLMNTQGDRIIVALTSGSLIRYTVREFANPKIAETVRVLPEGVRLQAIAFQNGENSLVIGGSDGSVAIWFGVDRPAATTADKIELTKVHSDFQPHSAAVQFIRVSQRTRLFITGDAKGGIRVRHGTTERTLLSLQDSADLGGLTALLFSPKDDALLAIGGNKMAVLWGVNVPHPETTLQSLFGKVWYEGYPVPDYVWQSTAGTDAPEPKLSLIPLIFGTFKAAFYSLMLAIPIALLGAIYTSEFMTPRGKNTVKPIMELMASLPSVVVGFVAALVLSPIVENWIAAVVLAFVLLPLVVISVSYVWQLLPQAVADSLDGLPKLFFYALAIVGSVLFVVAIGPWVELTFFGGDFKRWSGGEGSGEPFLFLMLIPVSLLLAVFVSRRLIAVRSPSRNYSRSAAATLEFGRWVLILALTVVVAWAGAAGLHGLGYDVRGGFVDTYVQRNALVVAFALAFTQIPLIYSIAEDSLSAVPAYLRAASLACGASPWQTASRVIVPTAASGIFSAIMIGLGRAVGETMIVVMATGNTPIVEANIFNGLRTLSANINVELPEAVRDSTLYRTLFLCALVLFVMTFVINTVAELVRQRYRKRSAQL